MRSILYVDDEPSNLVVFEATFEDDFDVIVASSAAEALEILKKKPIPVVVADQRMPNMTGVEMFQILRREAPHIQRVILSGFTESESLIDAINDGQIFQFVRKPWDRDELFSVLQRALDAHDMLLQNSILQEKLALAERCAMLGRSAASIAHEMGNQLGLLPLIEMIEEEYSADPLLVEMASLAKMTDERLRRLINEIQNFVRRDAYEARPAPFSVRDCITELKSFLQFNDALDIERIKFEIQGDAVVLGSPFKIQQVIINLLRNALDATPTLEEGGLVRLSIENTGESAQISVTDNGSGISEDMMEQIWQPFYTTKGKSGTGLGLDVVQSIIQAHDGKISCQSVPGSGTTFEIQLPLSIQKVASASEEDESIKNLATPTETSQKLTNLTS